MKRLGFMCLGILLATGCGNDSPTAPTNPNIVILTAQLSAASEVPPVTNAESSARGTVRVTMELTRDGSNNVTGGTVSFLINLSNFPSPTNGVAAHIHQGVSTVAGPVRIGIPSAQLSASNPISMPSGGASNVIFNSIAINTDATTLNALNSLLADPANFYFNVHTPLNPGGAVRGQLARE